MAATDRTQQILPGGQSAAPYAYPVPASLLFNLLAVRAVFDGTSASGPFLPAVQLVSDAGVVMAQVEGQAVAAGGSADVTFAPFLGEQSGSSCCNTQTSDYAATVLGTSPRALWKFDETSGNTAHDATGNGWNLAVAGVGPLGPGAWTWENATSPPGTFCPFVFGGGPHADNGSFPARSTNWAAGGWINLASTSSLVPPLMTQGDPNSNPAAGGWTIECVSGPNLWTLIWGDGAGAPTIASNSAAVAGTWYLVGAQDDNGTLSLWVNGVKQTATAANTMVPHGGITFGLSDAGSFHLRGNLSWSFVWDRPLTADEWATLYAPGGSVPQGWVLTSTGAGTAAYSPLQSGSATAGYKLYADGAGGTYWAP